MFLPRMPYNIRKMRREIIAFRGLNRTEMSEDGQLKNSAGVSSALFPTLCQSKPFVAAESYGEGITDMFEHSGILSYVKDGTLYYDGKAVAKVSSGKKQWAVVNTKLCIFPDKIEIDIKDGSVLYMEKEMQFDMAHNGTTITTDKLTVSPVTERVQNNNEEQIWNRDPTKPFAYFCAYTYGKDQAAVQRCYKRGTWQGLELYEVLKDVCYNNMGRRVEVGDIFIPQVTEDGGLTYSLVTKQYTYQTVDGEVSIPPEYLPDKVLYNSAGYYAVVTGIETDLDAGAKTYLTYDVYKTDGADVLFEGSFEVGDAVTISGTLYGLKDAENIIVSGVDGVENSLVFEGDAIRDVHYYCVLDKQVSGGTELDLIVRGYYVRIVPKTVLMPGTILYTGRVTSGNEGEMTEITVHRWDESKKKVAESYHGEVFDEWVDGLVECAEYKTDSGVMTIKAAVPDLDYICESENRLWGVSNKTGTIYASELGLPHRFYTYGDLSTDSYAVAVGSEDEFTAICSYGGGVCCFKENKLHKILGSFPAEYYMSEYEIAGVQKGGARTLRIINEILYYKGVHGVYAYSGGTPRVISYELGEGVYTAGAAGTDGKAYYIGLSGKYGDELMVYDIAHDVWMCETGRNPDAMCDVGGEMYILSGGRVYINNGDIADAVWSAELAPLDEKLWEKKGYSRLTLKAEMQKGSSLTVYVRENNGRWMQVATKAAMCELISILPLRVGRCDRLGIKIEGKGGVTLRGIMREYSEGRI